MQISEVIRQGNICTTVPQADRPGRYLANGRFGAVLSEFGLNAQPRRQKENPLEGRSVLSHMSHWGRFRFISDATKGETAADYLLPLLRLSWEKEPQQVTDYSQVQDFYTGTVTTVFRNKNGQNIRVSAWADMEDKDLFCFRIALSKGDTAVLMEGVTGFIPYAFLYKKETTQTACAEQTDNGWKLTIRCEDTVNKACSDVYLHTNARVEKRETGLCLVLQPGVTEIFLRYGAPAENPDGVASLRRTEKAWENLWQKSGWFSFPEKRAQQMWVRSLAYLLSSYSDAKRGIQPTSGLSGNMFPFHFVQDMGYIAPALQMMGHTDIVKAWLEKFAGEIPQMRRYAKHLWQEAEGIYPPWELPFGGMEDYHRPCVPVIYCYEPHNVGYLCRMAVETADYLDDEAWTARVAAPLIRECAAFYRAAAQKREDGFWHLKWYPCVGQDEAGGRNKSDYLCSLYSAKYCFEAAVRFGLDETGDYARMISDGLCFPTLLSDRGTYHTVRGADDFGRQKHPVQLVGITYMPTETQAGAPETLAYQLRHEITDGAKIPYYEGWTLGQFLLAGTNLRDTEGWNADWAQLRAADYTDPDWVQIYETSGQTEKSFYMATHGLILQSLIRNYVNDYWGRLDVAACPVFGDGVAFGNIRTRLGLLVSGRVETDHCTYETTFYRD